jgi:hypothetical protein
MLMRGMTRFRFGVLIAFVALLATEPVYHNHPLIPDGNAAVQSLCAVCASGTARVTLSAPTVSAPTIVVERLIAVSPHRHSVDVPVERASRAPPAA